MAAMATGFAPAHAKGYPDHQITMIVPFPPGGPTDIVARLLAKQLSEQVGQSIVVLNKGGAGGTIGMQAAAMAKPDGYTILYNTSSIAMVSHLYKKLSFDPRKDFSPVALTASVPMVLLINPSIPADDVRSFIDYAHKHPGELSYASAGAGNVTHLTAFLFTQKAEINAQHIPYGGSAPAMVNLVGGQVQYMTNTLNDSLPLIREKRVKALAITSAQRSDLIPDVPTLAETVMPGYESDAWQGVVAPAGTPTEIIEYLNKEIRKAMSSDETLSQLKVQGTKPLYSTIAEYQKFLDAEIQRWGEVIRDAHVELN